LFKRLEKRKRIVAFIGYAAFIIAVFLLMPNNPDEVTAPMDLVNGFRAMSVVAVSIFWISLGVILGVLWQKYNPDKQIQTKTH